MLKLTKQPTIYTVTLEDLTTMIRQQIGNPTASVEIKHKTKQVRNYAGYYVHVFNGLEITVTEGE